MVGLRGNGGLAEQIAIVETKPALFTKIFLIVNMPQQAKFIQLCRTSMQLTGKSSPALQKDGRI